MDILIFVTLGTQDKPFKRLIGIVDHLVEKGIIKEEVIVQAGSTKYDAKNIKILNYISSSDFGKYIADASLLITHAGVGSIFTGLKYNKKILAIPRLKKYKEHHNDHQVELIEEFTKKGYIMTFNDEDSLEECLKKIDTFKPKKYTSNTNNMIKLINNYIEEN